MATLRKQVRALCEDGKTRVCYARAYWDGRQLCLDSDTWFSVPGYIRTKGTKVTGFLTSDDNGYKFVPYLYRKNFALVKPSQQVQGD